LNQGSPKATNQLKGSLKGGKPIDGGWSFATNSYRWMVDNLSWLMAKYSSRIILISLLSINAFGVP